MINGVRNFKLKNKSGAELDITRAGMLLWEPDGLGWGQTPTVEEVGGTYRITDTALVQPIPTGSMVFKNYAAYKTFLNFVQVGGVVLCYRPIDVWYYLDCLVTIGKSEIKPDTQRLICPVTFTGTSQWYEAVVSTKATVAGNSGKRYSYTYPYTYASTDSGSVIVKNGNLDSYMDIVILGPAVNPQWRLYQGGTQVATGKVNVSIPAGHKLVIDTHPASMEISEYLNDGTFVANRYGDSDFTTERLFPLPPGESTVVFTDDYGAVTNAYVEVRKRV